MPEDYSIVRRVSSRKRSRSRTSSDDNPHPEKKQYSTSPNGNGGNSLPAGLTVSPAKEAAQTWFTSSFQRENHGTRKVQSGNHVPKKTVERKGAKLKAKEDVLSPPKTSDVWLNKAAQGEPAVLENEDIFSNLSGTSTPKVLEKKVPGLQARAKARVFSPGVSSNSDVFNESDSLLDINAIDKLEEDYYSQQSEMGQSQGLSQKSVEKSSTFYKPGLCQNKLKNSCPPTNNSCSTVLCYKDELTSKCAANNAKCDSSKTSSSECSSNMSGQQTRIQADPITYKDSSICKQSVQSSLTKCQPFQEVEPGCTSNLNTGVTGQSSTLKKGGKNLCDESVCRTIEVVDRTTKDVIQNQSNRKSENVNSYSAKSFCSDKGQCALDELVKGCFGDDFETEIVSGAKGWAGTSDQHLGPISKSSSFGKSTSTDTVGNIASTDTVKVQSEKANAEDKTVSKVSKCSLSEKQTEPSLIANAADERTNLPEKPKSKGSSLSDKIKLRMQKNAKNSTPQSNRLQSLRRESMAAAKLEVEKILQEGTEYDIGPFYGLPSKVKDLLEKLRGITRFYDWQNECLSLPSVRHGKNLIYSLPTSGGKTLVAEILILQSLMCKKKDAIFILPFISVVQEKVRSLAPLGVDLDFLVEEYAASKGSFPPKKRRKLKSVYVCTIEKASTLISSLIEAGRIDEVGLVVVDELHMLGEGAGRGACLELALVKVMYASASLQIIGMSATLNNIGDLQKFLKAELYTNDFRPVSLTEHIKVEDKVYEVKPGAPCSEEALQLSRILTFPYSKEMLKNDPDYLLGLVMEVIPDHSCLVFCPTKKNCENVGKMLCKMMPLDLLQVKTDKKKELLKILKDDGNGQVCPVLRQTIPYGVAYHHSGLTMDERKAIEDAYSDGTLCMLTCTSTLAAGVNLPAKRVILRSPHVGNKLISRSQYKQMVGRAGRAGIDTSGESILVIKNSEMKKIQGLIEGPYTSCNSSLLYQDDKGIKALMLSVIGLKLVTSSASAVEFLSSTLFAVQSRHLERDVKLTTQTALQQLLDIHLIKQVKTDDGLPSLEVTDLGRATYRSGMDYAHAQQLHSDLVQASDSLVIANYLHLLYLATPYDMVQQVNISWKIYLDQFSVLRPSELKVATCLGITDSYITKKVSGQVIRKGVNSFVVARFYLALMLYDLWHQQTIWDVAQKYLQPRGFIQNLLTGAATFASCIKHFCQELDEFWAYQDLLGNFVKRLSFCVAAELIPLMEIPGVRQGRAKQLYKAGYKSLSQLAHANPEDLVKEIEHLPRKAAKNIVASAKMLLIDKVESLKDEVEELIAMPLNPDQATGENMEIDTKWFEDDLSFEKG